MEKGGANYIMANSFRHLYTGVTSELAHRVAQHKNKAHPHSHTARYNITNLVYYRYFETITEAIAREKQIKNMHRIRKIALIVALNPTWRDLSEDWGKPTPPFDESQLRKPQTF